MHKTNVYMFILTYKEGKEWHNDMFLKVIMMHRKVKRKKSKKKLS